MPERTCYAYAEDPPSCSVIRKLVEFQGKNSATGIKLRLAAGFPLNKHGCGDLKKMIPAVCNMVKAGVAVVILTDLDLVECAPKLIRSWFPRQRNEPDIPHGLLFRIAVRGAIRESGRNITMFCVDSLITIGILSGRLVIR